MHNALIMKSLDSLCCVFRTVWDTAKRPVDLIGLKAQQHLSLGQRPRLPFSQSRTLKAYFTRRNELERKELRNAFPAGVPPALSVQLVDCRDLGRCPRLRCQWAFSPPNPIKSTGREAVNSNGLLPPLTPDGFFRSEAERRLFAKLKEGMKTL